MVEIDFAVAREEKKEKEEEKKKEKKDKKGNRGEGKEKKKEDPEQSIRARFRTRSIKFVWRIRAFLSC